MAAGINYAVKYASKIDERFTKESQAALVTNNDYKFTGAKTVEVYSMLTVPLQNYTRSGANRYGTPSELQDDLQELTVTQDRSFTFTIDKGNRVQTPGIRDAAAALQRQIKERLVPEYDAYVFRKIAMGAPTGNKDTTDATKSNAYELFLAAQEALFNNLAPAEGRVCLCTGKFYNFLKQDPAFVRYGDSSQAMLKRGVLGTVDGVRIVLVPESRFPGSTGTGAKKGSFILTHKRACVAPKQIWDYKIHENPPGISGVLVEGRYLYDAFVLNNKAPAIWWQGPALSA